jgi:UDP-N-acetylmuramate dehydrogenase
MNIEENISLKEFTTFRVGGTAKYFTKLSNKEEIPELVKLAKEKSMPIFILGGGSNIIVSDNDFTMLVIKNEILGREILQESEHHVLISVGAGENWDECVAFCVEHGFIGVEALSAIPGTVGGAPIQNIGAYGTEAKDVIDSVLVYDIEGQDFKTFSNKECEFGYRDSVFKKFPGTYVVLEVVFKLQKHIPVKIPEYPGVAEKLKEKNIASPTLFDIRTVVTEIRARKLPDPHVIPNVGSFFKNPIISREIFEKIKAHFPNIKYFEVEGGIKIPAGWLIETAGLKGINFGAVGTYMNNAMVLVNNGDATFMDIKNAEEKIKTVIKEKFGIVLEREPVIINFNEIK